MAQFEIDYEPRPYQLEVHQDTHRFKIPVFQRQAGKTTLAVNELIEKCVTEPGVYLYVAPDKGAAKNIIWKDPDVLFKYIPPQIIKKKNETELTVYFKPTVKGRPGSVLYLEGAGDKEQIQRLRGIKPRGIVFDEYAQMPANVWTEILFPPINQNRGWAMFISTWKGKNHFYDLVSKFYDVENDTRIENADSDYKVWFLPYWKNPYFTKKQEMDARETMTPAQFDQEYALIPMSGTSNVFPSVSEIMTGGFEEPHKQHYYYMGIDLARVRDWTAVSIIDRNTHRLVYQDRWQGEWSTTLEKIVALRKKYNDAKITIDSTGVGDPIAEMLRKRGCKVDDFKFSNSSKDKIIKKLGIFFGEKRILLPPITQIPNLLKEIEAFSYTILESGKVKYSAPNGMTDDEVYALALAVWQLKERPIDDLYIDTPPPQTTPDLDPFGNTPSVDRTTWDSNNELIQTHGIKSTEIGTGNLNPN